MKLIGGWPWPWTRQPWAALAAEYRELVTELPAIAPVLAVIESVIENGMEDRLTASTALRDLLVTTEPPSDPPIDVIIVRSVMSMKPSREGEVTIEHVASSGLTESITRPDTNVLPLFWRFVAEKYGLSANRA